jgi:hypothetical protein
MLGNLAGACQLCCDLRSDLRTVQSGKGGLMHPFPPGTGAVLPRSIVFLGALIVMVYLSLPFILLYA